MSKIIHSKSIAFILTIALVFTAFGMMPLTQPAQDNVAYAAGTPSFVTNSGISRVDVSKPQDVTFTFDNATDTLEEFWYSGTGRSTAIPATRIINPLYIKITDKGETTDVTLLPAFWTYVGSQCDIMLLTFSAIYGAGSVSATGGNVIISSSLSIKDKTVYFDRSVAKATDAAVAFFMGGNSGSNSLRAATIGGLTEDNFDLYLDYWSAGSGTHSLDIYDDEWMDVSFGPQSKDNVLLPTVSTNGAFELYADCLFDLQPGTYSVEVAYRDQGTSGSGGSRLNANVTIDTFNIVVTGDDPYFDEDFALYDVTKGGNIETKYVPGAFPLKGDKLYHNFSIGRESGAGSALTYETELPTTAYAISGNNITFNEEWLKTIPYGAFSITAISDAHRVPANGFTYTNRATFTIYKVKEPWADPENWTIIYDKADPESKSIKVWQGTYMFDCHYNFGGDYFGGVYQNINDKLRTRIDNVLKKGIGYSSSWWFSETDSEGYNWFTGNLTFHPAYLDSLPVGIHKDAWTFAFYPPDAYASGTNILSDLGAEYSILKGLTIIVIDTDQDPGWAQKAVRLGPKGCTCKDIPRSVTLAKPTNALPGWSYKSSKPSVATVDPVTGKVTGVSEGTAKITLTANNTGDPADDYTKTITVTVAHKVTKITAKNVTVKAKKSAKVKVKTVTSAAKIKSVKSSNTKIASVKRVGKTLTVKGKKAGKCTITVTTWDGKTKKIKVTVKK